MKKCKDCKRIKSINNFYRSQGECKTCTKKRVSKNYRKNIEYYKNYDQKRNQTEERKNDFLRYQKTKRLKYRGRSRAYNKVAYAIKSGKLIKEPCLKCGDIKTQAHHEDYRKPLMVKWLCFKHHKEIHGQVSNLGSF